MIPQFPKFKKIELSDRENVESFTKKFPPYSDFNFVSMWSWDIKGEMEISQLNGNLVVKFNDYITRKPFYSFLGNTMVDETARILLDFSIAQGLDPILELVPEDSVKALDHNLFKIEEDRNNHDYIIPSETFKEYNTKKTRTKKNSVKQFLDRFSPQIVNLNLSEEKSKKAVYDLFHRWSSTKDDPLEIENERHALERFIENKCGDKDHLCTGVFNDDQLIGFCLSEKLNGNFSNIHFCKADTAISPGTYAYILQENARSLLENGHTFINIEQDLGIDTIRQWKMSHGTELFLKKYTVEYNKSYIRISSL